MRSISMGICSRCEARCGAISFLKTNGVIFFLSSIKPEAVLTNTASIDSVAPFITTAPLATGLK